MHDAVTLYTAADGRPINKIVRRLPDGSITKGMIEHRQHYVAEHVRIPTLAALAKLLEQVGRRPDQALSLSVFHDPPAPVWHTWSASRMAKFLGCGKEERVKLAGWHDVGTGIPTCVRMKENMGPSWVLMFDRDAADGMPPELARLDFTAWCEAVDLLHHGFAKCGKVWQPSTTGRVLVDGAPLHSESWHAFVLVDDPDAVPAAWAYAFERCAITKFSPAPWDDPVTLGFAKPRHSRATGEVMGHQLWTIYDRSTWAVNRLVFDGCPTVEGPGLSIAPPQVRVVEGPSLAVSAVRAPTTRELKLIREASREITGHEQRPERTYGVASNGRHVVSGTMYVIADLALDLEVESSTGATTVEEFMRSGLDHLRIQSPYRESASWAAFLGMHKDGTPFIFDSGTSEKHVLDRGRLEQRMWQVIVDWLREAYQPAFGYPDGGVFSRQRGRKMLPRDVHENAAIIDRLAMASDAPCVKGGGINRLALPTEFRKWLKVAWGELLWSLPSEIPSSEEDAVETLPAQIRALLLSLVSTEDPTPWGNARRAAGTWAHWYASQAPGRWNRVGSLAVWGRIKDGQFQIALRYELAAQISRVQHAEIAAMGQNKFRRRCKEYDICEEIEHVHSTVDGRHLQDRAVILTATFVDHAGLSTEHRDMRAEAIRHALEDVPVPPKGGTGNGSTRMHDS